MTKTLTLKTSHQGNITATLEFLDLSYLDQIMHLQNHVYTVLPDPSWYACTSREGFIEDFSNGAKFLGCLTADQQLIALGVYLKPALNEHNYGYDINLSEDDLLLVGHIESTIVHPDFRGNKLQQHLCIELEATALEESTPLMLATVCPDNIYSLNTFINLGYTIEKEKLKYGGLRRYIVKKNLS